MHYGLGMIAALQDVSQNCRTTRCPLFQRMGSQPTSQDNSSIHLPMQDEQRTKNIPTFGLRIVWLLQTGDISSFQIIQNGINEFIEVGFFNPPKTMARNFNQRKKSFQKNPRRHERLLIPEPFSGQSLSRVARPVSIPCSAHSCKSHFPTAISERP